MTQNDLVILASVDEMFQRLEQHLAVIGLGGYGSDHHSENVALGDVDLFVETDALQLEVESLHFRAGEVPVDLNLIDLEALQNL